MATSKIVTSSITDDAVTSGKIASGVVPTLRPNAQALLINGSMEVSQRGTSFTSNGYSLDRYTIDESTDGAITVTQDTDVPSGYGFGKSLKVDCTTADASIGAAQYCIFTSKLEGQNFYRLGFPADCRTTREIEVVEMNNKQ